MTGHFNYDNIERAEYEAPDNSDGNVGPVEHLLDVPADAINASTGTGENLGVFGEIDRALDYRTLTGEMDADSGEWADPTEETTGLSGAFHATAGQAAAATEDVGETALGKHWKLIAGVGLVILLYLAVQSSPAGVVVP